MARAITQRVGSPPRRGSAAWAVARAAFRLVGGAVVDIVHEVLMQGMLATDLASMLSGALTGLVARLFKSARGAVGPERDGATLGDAARRRPNEST